MALPFWSAGDPQRCDCPCHGDPMIQHIIPCCAACSECGACFAKGLEQHERNCDGTPPTQVPPGQSAAT
jgi:hypothetical protein